MELCEKWLKIGKKILKILNCFFETFLLHRPKQFWKLNIQSKSCDLTVAYNDILVPFLSSCFGECLRQFIPNDILG